MKIILTFMLVVFAIDKSFSAEFACEKVEEYNHEYHDIDKVHGCFMNGDTKIAFPESTISNALDDTVEGLTLALNRKIKFLPIKVADSFPNLLVFNAMGCSIQALSAETFKNLNKLKVLNVGYNFVQSIADGTFDDLKALEYLALSKNIVSLNLCCSIKFLSRCFRRQQDKKIERCGVQQSPQLEKRLVGRQRLHQQGLRR